MSGAGAGGAGAIGAGAGAAATGVLGNIGRRAGVLLHPTSLAGDDGQGALGTAARGFVDWLQSAGFGIWQVLPLGPVGDTHSPYWAQSDNAFNPTLIDWREAPGRAEARSEVEEFRRRNAWVENYALFAALRDEQQRAWTDWPLPLRLREAGTLAAARQRLAGAIDEHAWKQWLLDRQWRALRAYARERGVLMFGDLPIYVAPDSEAVWSAREQFLLQPNGEPAERAGVPPDYFAADGQLWGNPLYDWAQARRDGFAFWRARIALALGRFDLLRIDHFRGLESYWSVPAGAVTAREGRWVPAPGAELMSALAAAHPELPLVAEDLGDITPAVDDLRMRFGLPGMRVLQFGFDGAGSNPHLAHNFERNSVVYTGTHDNDTAAGWYRTLPDETRRLVDFTLRSDVVPMPEALIRDALFSVANLAIIPAQDLIGAGSEARFNTPGTVAGNWSWRLPRERFDAHLAGWLRALLSASGRLSAGGGH